MSHPLGGQALDQVAKVDKTGGGGSHTGDDSTLGNISQGETVLQHFGGIRHMGKQKIGQCLMIHNIYLFFVKFHS